MFSVLVIRLRSLRLLRVSGIVMRLRMFLLLITFLKASHSFRNRLLVICKNAYLFRSEERFSRNAETDLVCRLLLEKKKQVCADWALNEDELDFLRNSKVAFVENGDCVRTCVGVSVYGPVR